MSARKIAAIYSRVSTMAQAGPQKSSLENQLAECLAEARSQGYEVPEDLQFEDRMSGRRDDRPNFQRMMAAGRKKEFDRLFVWSVDRIGRTLRASVNAVEELKELGITTFSLKERDLSDTFVFGVLAGIAAREIQRLQERTIPAKEALREGGIFVAGRAPFGYRKREDGKLEKCPAEAAAVRQIFRACIAGMGRIQIAHMLNDENVLPPEVLVQMPDGSKRRMRPGQLEADSGAGGFTAWLEKNGGSVIGTPVWKSGTVANIMTNTAAYGYLRPADRHDEKGKRLPKRETVKLDIVDGPIISEAEFRDAQRAKTARNVAGRRPRTPWLLVGRIFCGCCGSRYIHTDSKGTHYYVCNVRKNREPRGACTTAPYVKMVDVDNQVKDAIHDLLTVRLGGPQRMKEMILQQVLMEQRDILAEIAEVEAELAQADQTWKERQAKVFALLEAGYDLKTMPDVKEAVTQAAEERDRIAARLYALTDQKTIIDRRFATDADALARVLNRINAGLRAMTAAEAANGQPSDVVMLVKMLVKRVTVNADRTRTIDLHDDWAAITGAFMKLLETATGEVQEVDDIKRHLEKVRV